MREVGTLVGKIQEREVGMFLCLSFRRERVCALTTGTEDAGPWTIATRKQYPGGPGGPFEPCDLVGRM